MNTVGEAPAHFKLSEFTPTTTDWGHTGYISVSPQADFSLDDRKELVGYQAFVTRLTAGGNALVYSTYLGGSGDDLGNVIAVDGTGSAYVTGVTRSTNFPTQAPAISRLWMSPSCGPCRIWL